MIKAQLISVGARIPADLKKRVSTYCDRKGLKLQYFITEAIKEKLAEIAENEQDMKIVDERLKDSQFISQDDLLKYVRSRKKDR